MENTKNPLIHDNPADTLHHANCMLLLLEELHATTDYKRLQDDSISTGIFSLLQCANHAIAYEVERMEIGRPDTDIPHIG